MLISIRVEDVLMEGLRRYDTSKTIRQSLPHNGVVRVALPRDGRVFCTWLVILTRESLVDRAGALSRTKLDQLANALRLARIE